MQVGAGFQQMRGEAVTEQGKRSVMTVSTS
jgi:hypothetical protein